MIYQLNLILSDIFFRRDDVILYLCIIILAFHRKLDLIILYFFKVLENSDKSYFKT